MPDASGKLSVEEKAKIYKTITESWISGSKDCPICGDNKWIIADHVVEAPIITEGVRGFGAGAYPAVMLISQTCGYILHFNAVILGVVTKSGG